MPRAPGPASSCRRGSHDAAAGGLRDVRVCPRHPHIPRVPDRLQHLYHAAGVGAQVWVVLPACLNRRHNRGRQPRQNGRPVAVGHLREGRGVQQVYQLVGRCVGKRWKRGVAADRAWRQQAAAPIAPLPVGWCATRAWPAPLPHPIPPHTLAAYSSRWLSSPHNRIWMLGMLRQNRLYLRASKQEGQWGARPGRQQGRLN
jgi:hypothetical protein